MPLNEYWEVRIRQAYVGAGDIMNVFHLKSTNPSVDEDDVADAAIATGVPLAKAVQSTQLHYIDVVAQNLSEHFKVATVDASAHVGSVGGEYLPVWVAWEFISERTTNDIRHGYKRWAGVSEDSITNSIPSAITKTALDALAAAMAGSWAGGYEWHIIKRIKYTPPGKSTPRWRLPQPDAELVPSHITNCPFVRMTTQNTRKR